MEKELIVSIIIILLIVNLPTTLLIGLMIGFFFLGWILMGYAHNYFTSGNWSREIIPNLRDYDVHPAITFNPKNDNNVLERTVTGDSEIDPILQLVFQHIIQDYIIPWYGQPTCDKDEAVEAIESFYLTITKKLSYRIQCADWMPYFTINLVEDMTKHLRLFKQAGAKMKYCFENTKKLNNPKMAKRPYHKRNKSETDIYWKIDLEDKYPNRQLPHSKFYTGPDIKAERSFEDHFFELEYFMENKTISRKKACCDPEREKDVLSEITELFLCFLLPEQEYRSEAVRELMVTLFVSSVLDPILDTLSDPDFLNRMIIFMCAAPTGWSSDVFVSVLRSTDDLFELHTVQACVLNYMRLLNSSSTKSLPQYESVIVPWLAALQYLSRIVESQIASNVPTTVLPEHALNQLDFLNDLPSERNQKTILLLSAIDMWKLSAQKKILDASEKSKAVMNAHEYLKNSAETLCAQYFSMTPLPNGVTDKMVKRLYSRLQNYKCDSSDNPLNWFDEIQYVITKVLQEDEILVNYMRNLHSDLGQVNLKGGNDKSSSKHDLLPKTDGNAETNFSSKPAVNVPSQIDVHSEKDIALDRAIDVSKLSFKPCESVKRKISSDQNNSSKLVDPWLATNVPCESVANLGPSTSQQLTDPLTLINQSSEDPKSRCSKTDLNLKVDESPSRHIRSKSDIAELKKLWEEFNSLKDKENENKMLSRTQTVCNESNTDSLTASGANKTQSGLFVDIADKTKSIDVPIVVPQNVSDDINPQPSTSKNYSTINRIQSIGNTDRTQTTNLTDFYLSAVIIETGVVQEKGSTYGIYALEVTKNYNMEVQESYHIYKRYRDFHDLHTSVKERWPELSSLSFPGKQVLQSTSRTLLERRMLALNEYLSALTKLGKSNNLKYKGLLGQEGPLADFLKQQNHGDRSTSTTGSTIIQSILINPLKAGMQSLKNVPDQLANTVDEVIEGISKVFQSDKPSIENESAFFNAVKKENSVENEKASPVQACLKLADEILDLSTRHSWLRRRIVGIVETFYTETLNTKILEFVSSLICRDSIVEYLQYFEKWAWPKKKSRKKKTKRYRTKQSIAITKLAAKTALFQWAPDEAKRLIGTETMRYGLTTIFYSLQNKSSNKRFLLVMLEGIFGKLFPEFDCKDLFQKLYAGFDTPDDEEFQSFKEQTKN